MVWANVINPPPPTPVNALNTIICVAVFANDAARAPMKKIKMQLRSTVFREKMSDKRPYNN